MTIPPASVYLSPHSSLAFLYGCSPTLLSPFCSSPPLTASPPIPHASLSQLSRLPSVSHLPFLSPTCPLNFIYKRAARLPFNGSPCAPAVQPSQKPRLHRTFQTDSKGRLVRQKTGAENWDGESRLPSPIHRMGHLSTRA